MNKIIYNQCIYCGKKHFTKNEMLYVMNTGECQRCANVRYNRETLNDNTPTEFMSDELYNGIINKGL